MADSKTITMDTLKALLATGQLDGATASIVRAAMAGRIVQPIRALPPSPRKDKNGNADGHWPAKIEVETDGRKDCWIPLSAAKLIRDNLDDFRAAIEDAERQNAALEA